MKKRVLSILLCLCLVLALCPVTALAEEGKTVSFTVTADKTEAQPGDTITFTVTMGAVDRLGYLMLGLSIPEGMTYVANSGTVPEGLKEKMSAENVEVCELPYLLVLSSDYTSTADTVLMTFQCTVNDDATPGDKAVGVCLLFDSEESCLDVDSKVIAASFTPATVTVPEPALAITVDGFQVGNTPADTTLSFASTNLGVTFSKDDVELAVWEQYDDEFDQWDGIGSEAFQADKRYQLVLRLNDKGLSALPAVTINGNTPEHCGFEEHLLVIECEFGTLAEPALAITVDGFQVGNTPADITYSFASTNLDVTFDESDILENIVRWEYYSGEYKVWLSMSNTEVFEAGTRYWCTINLDNKGLDTAPAVTVNGKTPELCGIATKDGVPIGLQIACILGTPAPAALTISGPDEVCAEQDYEFSATASEGAEISYFQYR